MLYTSAMALEMIVLRRRSMLANGSNGGAMRMTAVDGDELASLIVEMEDAADAALCNNCIPSIAMGDGTAERVIARMNESSEEDKARRFDGGEDAGEDGGSATLKGRVEDMSKVTCIPLLAVAVVEDAGVPQRPEAELVSDGAMSMNNEWFQP